MRLRFLLSAIVLVSVGACSGSLARLAGPNGALQGSWQTWPLVPSGSGVNMSLATTGSNVVGTGRASALQYDLGPLTVTGQQEIDGAFRLTVRYDESGATATYAGRMAGANELDGEWSGAGHASYQVTFRRQ